MSFHLCKSGIATWSVLVTVAYVAAIHSTNAMQAYEVATNTSNPISKVHQDDAPMYTWSNTSWTGEMQGLAYFASDMEASTCVLSENAKGRVVVHAVNQQFHFQYRLIDWAIACEKVGCLAFLHVQDSNPTANGWGGHFYWEVRTLPFPTEYPAAEEDHRKFTTTPIPTLSGFAPTWDWLQLQREDIRNGVVEVMVVLAPDDYNEGIEALRSIPLKTVTGMAMIQALLNLILSVYKVQQIVISRMSKASSDPVPKSVTFILVPEIIANILRAMLFMNFSLFEMTAFEFRFGRMLFSTTMTLGIASTIALSDLFCRSVCFFIIMFVRLLRGFSYLKDVIHQNSKNPNYKKTRFHRVIKVIEAMVCFVVLLDIGQALLLTFGSMADFVPATVLGGTYTVIQLPISIAFIRFGFATAKEVSSSTSAKASNSTDASRLKKRQRFSQRIFTIGIAMVVNLCSLISFTITSKISEHWFLYSYFLMQETASTVSSLQIIAVRTPDKPAHSTKVAPDLNRLGAESNMSAAATGRSATQSVQNQQLPVISLSAAK